MAAYTTGTGGPWCYECRYSLSGLPEKGCCPECGKPYSLEEPPPEGWYQRWTARNMTVAVRDASPWMWEKWAPSLRSVAVFCFVAGSAAITVGLAVAAWRALMRQIGM